MLLALLLGCGPDTCQNGDEPNVGVWKKLAFARADGDVSDGFDLDGAVTTEGAASGCGVPDFTDPSGAPGVDNALARILPALDLTEAVAVEGIIQNAIHSGELLFLWELDGLDDPADDDCVDFTLSRGIGAPTLGTDGTLESGQTFDRDPAVPAVTATGLVMTDGVIVASPLEVSIPIQIFDVEIDLVLYDASLRLVRDESGAWTGTLGGGVDYQVLMDVANDENVDDRIAPILEDLLTRNADLAPDETGVCRQLSATFQYESTPAFFFEDQASE